MKQRRRGRLVAVAVLFALLAAACSSSSEEGATAAPTVPNPATFVPTSPPIALTATPTPGVVHVTPTAGGRRGESPAPVTFPWESKVPVDAIIAPSCVVRGEEASIRIRTRPRAAVAYHAVYSGTKGGAPPPYGSGYGGNDSGMADEEDGVYTDSWTVRADAPVGPARADVVVGYGDSFGYDDPGFYVAASRSGCP